MPTVPVNTASGPQRDVLRPRATALESRSRTSSGAAGASITNRSSGKRDTSQIIGIETKVHYSLRSRTRTAQHFNRRVSGYVPSPTVFSCDEAKGEETRGVAAANAAA